MRAVLLALLLAGCEGEICLQMRIDRQGDWLRATCWSSSTMSESPPERCAYHLKYNRQYLSDHEWRCVQTPPQPPAPVIMLPVGPL